MTVQRLFISHFSGDAAEVGEFASALRLRGVVPWVDKDGGYQVADDSEEVARRALRDECFGLALWATRPAFDRRFIRDVEMDEAGRLLKTDPGFLLFAVPRDISFDDLKVLSTRSFGIDLSRFHTMGIDNADALHPTVETVARQIMGRLLRRAASASRVSVSLQVATRERLPTDPQDLLVVDASDLLRGNPENVASWNLLLHGLCDVKAEISAALGRPQIRVNGSKHLSAGFVIGRVFAPFSLAMRQTPCDIWESDCGTDAARPFTCVLEGGDRTGGILVVEVASGLKNVRAGIECTPELLTDSNACRLSLRATLPQPIDNMRCVAMARQAYEEIEVAVARHRITEIHLFVAAPVSFMAFLGSHFKGMPDTVTYEWQGGRYVRAAIVPGCVL